MWPDCSPPSDRPRCSISSITYLSPTELRTRSMPSGLQRELEADVAHHGRDDRVAAQPALALQLAARTSAAPRRRRRCGRCWSTKIARSPSPSNATPMRAAARHDGLAPAVRDGSSRSPRLMLRPSGRSPIDDRLEAEAVEQLAAPRWSWRRWRSRARSGTGAVFEASGNDRAQVIEIGVDQIGARHRTGVARGARSTSGRPRSPRLRARRASVNFSPSPENTLMPLSSNGLCDAEITTPAS